LEIKVNDIKQRHTNLGTKGTIDYETDLVMLEDNNLEEDKKYIVDSDANSDINDSPDKPSPEDATQQT
jgi:hypothetical protein